MEAGLSRSRKRLNKGCMRDQGLDTKGPLHVTLGAAGQVGFGEGNVNTPREAK